MFFDDFNYVENLDLFTGKIINYNEDGYIYGNMFKDEYIPYKDYKIYKLIPRNDMESLKLKIMEETFTINDLNLYLDIHPDDLDIYNKFKEHIKLLNKYKDEYQNLYGSICLNDESNKYNWINSPWPWEDKNV